MSQYDDIITRGFESKELDYKGPIEWDNKKKEASCELVKDIIAMANTGGGWIVIGVEEDDNGVFRPVGLSTDQLCSFETTRLANFLNKYAEPPINCKIVKHQYERRDFIIIIVPSFASTPHVVKMEYPSVLNKHYIYVRTDDNASDALARHADFTSLIERAVIVRREQLLSSFKAILSAGKQLDVEDQSELKFNNQIKEIRTRAIENNEPEKQGLGRLEVVFHPTEYKEERYAFKQLEEMLKGASEDFTGWPFIFVERFDEARNVADGIEFGESVKPLHEETPAYHYWHAKRTGLLFVNETLREDTLKETEARTYLDFVIISQETAKMVDALVRYYRNRVDPGENISLTMRITKTKGRKLKTHGELRPIVKMMRPKECIVEPIQKQVAMSYADWEADVVGNAFTFAEYVFNMFSCESPDFGISRHIMERMFERKLY